MQKPAYWAINQIAINGKTGKRLMLVLKTAPCERIIKGKRCFICGFDYHSRGSESFDIVAQFDYLKQTIDANRIERIDFLGSGSILDDAQVDYRQVIRLMREVKKIKSLRSILIEGRVEYCNPDKLKEIKKLLSNIQLEYGIGLECYSDNLRNEVLGKELEFQDFINCLKALAGLEIGVCTYILAGIPGLSIEASLREARDSILAVADLYRELQCKGRIALYPIFIAPNSKLEELYNYGKYNLLSLNQLVKILLQLKGKINLKKCPVFVGLDDEGISHNRYVGFGDGKLGALIKKFNYRQDFSLFKNVI